MICPHCGHDNLPGSEECSHCQMDMTQLDRPIPSNRIERSLMDDPVTVLRPRRPVAVRSSTTVGDTIKLLLENEIGALLVVNEEGELVGIFSERDLLTKVAGLYESYAELPIHMFMTANPETVSTSDTLAFAIHKMDVGGYRHLPVIHHGAPVGVVSVRDMLRHITRLC
jgi:CBS domain-containing protein